MAAAFQPLRRLDHPVDASRPDEVNWLTGRDDPTLTRQICNGWKADRLIASTVLDARLGEAVATLAGWPDARIIKDNVLWKPAGAFPILWRCDGYRTPGI